MNKKPLLAAGLATFITVLWLSFDLGQYLSLSHVQSQLSQLHALIAQHPVQASLFFFIGYVVVTALSLPGAAIMTLLGAALFGFWWGLALISFASSLGATLAFLFSRFILRNWVQAKFGHRLAPLNAGIEKDGAFYLFSLRLIPVFPFFLINLLMGLTPIRPLTFYLVSQIGMLAGTIIYVNAGTQLAQLDSLQGIVSPSILGSLALLGLFPWFAKAVMNHFQNRRRYAKWAKPKHFDRNMIVIGAGAGGLVSAYIAAAVKAKVSLIEKHKMGGDCLNTGCVPSKALLRSAHCMTEVKQAEDFGIAVSSVTVNFAHVMERVQHVIQQIEPHDSVERYGKLGVDCIQGEAKILSPWEVEVNGQTLRTRNIVIATGARPLVPNIPGLANVNYYTSDTVWSLREQPKRLLVLGGGPIGCELAQSFSLLGCKVTLVEMAEQVLIQEDADAALLVKQQLEHDGVTVLTGHKAMRFSGNKHAAANQAQTVYLETSEQQQTQVEFDGVLLALGRVANVQGFGLEELGITTTHRGTVEVNPYLQTQYPNIFAVGDVAGPFQLTHAAAHQAWYAAVNGLFGAFKKFKADYSVIPAATYTSPELARVGLNEKQAKQQGLNYDIVRFELSELDRAITDGATNGFIKVITLKGKDKILGATIVGSGAGELLAEFTLAMRHGLGLNKILATIHPYPTMSEAAKYSAGEWKRRNAPQAILAWLTKYHRWMRKQN